MGAFGDDPPPSKHQDAVGLFHGREAVGHDQRGAPSERRATASCTARSDSASSAVVASSSAGSAHRAGWRGRLAMRCFLAARSMRPRSPTLGVVAPCGRAVKGSRGRRRPGRRPRPRHRSRRAGRSGCSRGGGREDHRGPAAPAPWRRGRWRASSRFRGRDRRGCMQPRGRVVEPQNAAGRWVVFARTRGATSATVFAGRRWSATRRRGHDPRGGWGS